MLACLGSFIVTALVGVLVLARSMSLTAPIEGTPRCSNARWLAYSTALLTALFAAGMAGLIAYLILSNLVK